ncbi:Uncharacterised protein [Mycolicibacterium flavescens]|uniref:hypothetical protein n=1 Tax=Mycobacterium neumannii TaxID=2048551 RepID=UPI000B944697|nr:hypothetical protein [Mycobacterium neumannii]VEG40472.1 Uncharacterised protein [Mycolicibacterium flavescens]
MPNVYNGSIRDAEYVARVRRHSPSSLLPLVAQTAANYWEPGSWLKSPFKKYTPWALADIARISLISGNESRSRATQDDVLQCCAAYVAVNDPELGSSDHPDTLTKFMLRITSEQDYYQPPFNEATRTAAIFEKTMPSKPLKIIKPRWDIDLFGCTLSQYVGTGFFVQAAAGKNGGRFSAAWFDKPELDAITAVLPVTVLAETVERNYEAPTAWFREQRRPKLADEFRRFTFNPLRDKPVVSGIVSDLLVPVLHEISRKISPLGVYYAGAKLWGNSFTDEVGDLFEQYVGRQLATIPNVIVHPEVVYDKGAKRGVDWIVVCDSVIILVEVKSVRPTEAVRVGTTDAGDELKRMLGRAYKQLNVTDELIATQHAAFAHIPANLPRVGLIVTMEPFAIANAKPIRDLIGASPNMPTSVCASQDIERLVTLQDQDVGTFLANFLTDPTKDGWQISTGLADMELSRNVILDQAWDSYEWGGPIKKVSSN